MTEATNENLIKFIICRIYPYTLQYYLIILDYIGLIRNQRILASDHTQNPSIRACASERIPYQIGFFVRLPRKEPRITKSAPCCSLKMLYFHRNPRLFPHIRRSLASSCRKTSTAIAGSEPKWQDHT